MNTHRSIQQIRSRLGDPINNRRHKETCRGQVALADRRLRPIRRREDNVVALGKDAHPLNGLVSAYYISMTEKLEDTASLLRQWLIKLVYFKWDWYCGERHHDMGIFTDREVAEEIAAQMRKETGKAWSVKELPVNGLLPERAVQYGFYSFPGSKSDAEYRNRVTRFDAVPHRDVQALVRLDSKLGKLQECIEGKCVKAL